MRIVFGSMQAYGAAPAEVHFTEGVYAQQKLTGFTVQDGEAEPESRHTPPPIVELPRQLTSGQKTIAIDTIEPEYEDGTRLISGKVASELIAMAEELQAAVRERYEDSERRG